MRRPIVVCTALSLAALTLAPGVVSSQSPASGWDPSAVTGSVRLSGWESSPAEGEALQATLDGFAAAYPNINVIPAASRATTSRRWLRTSRRVTCRTCST